MLKKSTKPTWAQQIQRNTNTTSANNNFTLAAIASFEQKILTKKKLATRNRTPTISLTHWIISIETPSMLLTSRYHQPIFTQETSPILPRLTS